MSEVSSTPMRHDKHGPSQHPYLVKCPAYQSKPGDNIHSVKGTFKHNLVYQLRNKEITREEIYAIEMTPCGEYDFTEEDADHVIDAAVQTEKAIKWFMSEVKADDFYELTEEWIDLSNLGITGGTPDFLMVADFDCLLILDYKFGMGEVTPWTEQLMSYLTGMLKARSLRVVYSGIIQPKLRDTPWIVRVPYEHLRKHEEFMSDVLLSAKSANPPRCPMVNCSYCAHYPCVAVKTMSDKAMVIASQGEVGDVSTMSPFDLVSLTAMAEKLKKLHGTLKEEIYHRLSNGEEVVGEKTSWVLRPGKSSYPWTSEGDAEEAMKELMPALNERIAKKNAGIIKKNAGLPDDEQKAIRDKVVSMDLFEYKMISSSKAKKLFGTSKAVMDVLSKYIGKMEGKLSAQQITNKEIGNE